MRPFANRSILVVAFACVVAAPNAVYSGDFQFGINYSAIRYAQGDDYTSTNWIGGGIDLDYWFSDRFGAFVQGTLNRTKQRAYDDYRRTYFETDRDLLYGIVGVEGRLGSPRGKTIPYLRIGAGVVADLDADPTLALQVGAGVTHRLSRKVRLRAIEIDVVNAKDATGGGRFSSDRETSVRAVVGIVFGAKETASE